MTMVSAKRTTWRDGSSGWGWRDTAAALETASRSASTTRVMANTALWAGSSQQGKARRASVASNCVVAMVCSTPSVSTKVDR